MVRSALFISNHEVAAILRGGEGAAPHQDEALVIGQPPGPTAIISRKM
jgi:hypothetical protein